MTKLSGRALALQVMNRIDANEAYANLALTEVLSYYPEADRREKSFCTELVYGTLRHLLTIDYILGRLLSRPLKSLNLQVKNILRLSLYQLMYLPDIPERAVVHDAVSQIKKTKLSGLSALINGVLRNYLRSKDQLAFPDKKSDFIHYLSVVYSHPRWLVERWLRDYGPDLTEKILNVDNERPPLTVRLNTYLAERDEILNKIEAEGVSWRPGVLLPEAVSLENLPKPIEELAVFKEGLVFVQDESSMLVGEALKPIPGEFIIDICAAPGGKSTHLAQLMCNNGKIISIDDHPHKIDLLRKNAARLKLDCITPTLGDARTYRIPVSGEYAQKADRILVDAPCSGTGVLRRRVDARYRKDVEDIRGLVSMQREILSNAAGLVKSGGTLVYSTCTLEKEEDEDQVHWFLENHPQFELEHLGSFLPANVRQYQFEPGNNHPWIKILPVSSGLDGFFISRFRKKAD